MVEGGSGRTETVLASDESEMRVRASLSVAWPGWEIRRVTRLFGWLNPTKEWFCTQEACEYTGWHRSTLLRFVNAGELERSQDGTGDPRYRRAALDDLLEGKRTQGARCKRKAA